MSRMVMNDIQRHHKDLYQETCIPGQSLGLLPSVDSKKKVIHVVVGVGTKFDIHPDELLPNL